MWVWSILAKGIVAYLVFRFAVQLIGVRRVSETGTLELAMLISLAVFAGLGALGNAYTVSSVAVLYALWLGMFLLERYVLVRSRSYRSQMCDDDPTVLVYHGKILEHNLYRKRLTVEQLLSKLRARDAFRLADVELALLEPDGDFSIMRTPQSEPLTKQDVLVAGRHYGLPMNLIVEGEIIHENLEKRGLSEKWLRDHLRAFGVEFASEVILAAVDDNNELFVDKYDDHLQRQRDLHPHQWTDAGSKQGAQRQEQLREKPISQAEQLYAERQLNQAMRDSLPNVPKKK
jgi:uncharacterized membrane protein YcaP (DUF421 family)